VDEKTNAVREIIDYVVGVTERSSPEQAREAIVAAVDESGASRRDVALAFSTLVNALQQHLEQTSTDSVVCSFCQKSPHDVKSMVQGPVAAICNECIAICSETVSSRKGLLRKLFGRSG
jgi:hypothetical protein